MNSSANYKASCRDGWRFNLNRLHMVLTCVPVAPPAQPHSKELNLLWVRFGFLTNLRLTAARGPT